MDLFNWDVVHATTLEESNKSLAASLGVYGLGGNKQFSCNNDEGQLSSTSSR